MANNNITYVDLFNTKLDEAMQHGLLTSWMDDNAGKVKYEGGKKVKIPTMKTSGLGNYKRTNGTTGGAYAKGSVELTYEEFTMTQDRSAEFHIDRFDTDESNYVVDMAKVMGKFQKDHVVGEIDAYRISTLCTKGISAGNVAESKTITSDNVRREFKDGIKAIRRTGYTGEIVAHISYDVLAELELSFGGQLRAETFSKNGVDTRILKYDGVELIPTPDNLLVTKITTTEEGWTKAESGKKVNFVMAAKIAPIAVNKCDKVKIFTPDVYQNGDDYVGQYRRYHDCWITKANSNLIWVNSPEASVAAMEASTMKATPKKAMTKKVTTKKVEEVEDIAEEE